MSRWISLCAVALLMACGPAANPGTALATGPVTYLLRSSTRAFYQLEQGAVMTVPWAGGEAAQVRATGHETTSIWAQDDVAYFGSVNFVSGEPGGTLWTPAAIRSLPPTRFPLQAAAGGEWLLMAEVQHQTEFNLLETTESLEPGPVLATSTTCVPRAWRAGTRVVATWCEGPVRRLAAWTPGDFAGRVEFDNATETIGVLDPSQSLVFLDSDGGLWKGSLITGETTRIAEGVAGISISTDRTRIAWRTPTSLFTSAAEPLEPLALVSDEPVLQLSPDASLSVFAYLASIDPSELREWKLVSRAAPGQTRLLAVGGAPEFRPVFSEDATVVAYRSSTGAEQSSALFVEDVATAERTQLAIGIGWVGSGAGRSIHYTDNDGDLDGFSTDFSVLTNLLTSNDLEPGQLIDRAVDSTPAGVAMNPGSRQLSYLITNRDDDGTDRRGVYLAGP